MPSPTTLAVTALLTAGVVGGDGSQRPTAPPPAAGTRDQILPGAGPGTGRCTRSPDARTVTG